VIISNNKQAKGITVDTFIAQQEDLVNRFESGSFGYRGLQGSSSRRPSEIVEKILHTLKEKEKELRRKNSTQSWISPSTLGGAAIPSRFRVMDPHRKTFESIVEQVSQSPTVKTRPKSFKTVAKSLLNAEENASKELRVRKPLSGHHETGLEDISENTNNSDRELSDSFSSDMSDNSDWSDDERETLEKRFGAMSERTKECEKLRSLRRSRRQSRRVPHSHGLGSPCNSNWEIAKLVYSRDSSLSGRTASSLNSSSLELDRGSLTGGESSVAGDEIQGARINILL